MKRLLRHVEAFFARIAAAQDAWEKHIAEALMIGDEDDGDKLDKAIARHPAGSDRFVRDEGWNDHYRRTLRADLDEREFAAKFADLVDRNRDMDAPR